MVKVEVLTDFLVDASNKLYVKGWKGEVSKELAERHGPDGTGFLKLTTTSRTRTRKQQK